MQNKSMMQREDAGWAQMRRQLDLEMPAQKKDRKVIWLFLLAGLGLLGLIWFSGQVFNTPEVPASPVARPLEETAGIGTSANDQFLTHSTLDKTEPGLNSSRPADSGIPPSNGVEAVKQASATSPSGTNPQEKAGSKVKKAHLNAPEYVLKEERLPSPVIVESSAAEVKVSTDLMNARVTENLAVNQEKTNVPAEVQRDTIAPDQVAEAVTTVTEKTNGARSSDASLVDNKVPGMTSPIASAEAEMESPVEINTEKPGHHHGFIALGTDYAGDHFMNPYLTGGLRLPVSGRFYLAGQAGLSYQIKKNQSRSASSQVTLSSQASGKYLLDAGNASTGGATLDADDLFVDAGRSLTGFSGDSLLLTAGDQVTYYSSNQWMALAQAGLGYRILPGFTVESGFHYRYYTGAFRDYVSIQSTNPFGNGFNTSNTATYKLRPAVSRQQFSLYLNTGLQVTNRLGLVLQVAGKPFSLSSSRTQANEAGLNTSASNKRTALELPVKQNSAYYRFGLTLSF